ncbi:MAG: ATP-dependent Clp protease ATP-binding subunit [Anaerolineae bacterium]|jgi:ATP-dependent Clp protease ATP-binding subunit ClpC|nr:ATP-dependent Clp protease ATP-binding subunit [Anaerolineae bacterium]
MGTLNPDLLSKDLENVMNEAVALRDQHKKPTLMPELLLLALVRQPNTAAARLLGLFRDTRGVDLGKLERQIVNAIETRRDQTGNLDFTARGNRAVPLSRQTIILLDDALSVANSMNEVRIDTDHALAVLSESSMSTSGLLRQYGITPKAITDILSENSTVRRRTDGTTRNVVAEAKAGSLRAVYFREDLLRDIINILSQAVNRHVILVGPDGVGKRTLAYSLGLLMSQGKGPRGLSSLVTVDETALLDNDQQAIRAGLSKAAGGILFIPHIHRFFGGPIKAEFNKSTPIIQKAFLADDPVIIGSTTDIEYQQRLAGVSALSENSQIVRVGEPSIEETIEILKILKPHMESDYKLEIRDDAIQLAARMAKRYFSATPLPRSAEHLLHRTAAMVDMSQQSNLAFKPELKDTSLDAEDITLAASQMTGIPVNKLGEDERVRYASMVEHVKERIIGQDQAVIAVSRAIKTARVGLKDPKRPIGAFLFLGPTGVGKTELARALAEFMFGSEDAMLPLDMSEFKDESSLNRLLGSPSGYVDSESGGQLTERVKQQPYIIVLFDEVEKAHPRILDILLQVIEEGRLTDGRGNPVNFSETVIILTSNLGSEHLSVPVINEEIRELAMDSVREFFRPEFLNRLDEVIMFNALDAENLGNIMRLLLKKENKMATERGLQLNFTEGAVAWMLAQNDEPEYGARPLRRIIRRNVREPLADFLLRANPPTGTEVRIDVSDQGLTFAALVDGKEISVG